MEFHHIVLHDGDVDGEVERNEDNPASPDPPIWSEVVNIVSILLSFYSENHIDFSFSFAIVHWKLII